MSQSHPTSQPVATYLAENADIRTKNVCLIPRSYTNDTNVLARSVKARGGRAWVCEPDHVVCARVAKLDYVGMWWEQDFRDWAMTMIDTHKHPDPTQQVKLPVVLMDAGCTQQDYMLAWRFVRDKGTLTGIAHESVVSQLSTWIKAVDADVENFPADLGVDRRWRFVRASKTIVGMRY